MRLILALVLFSLLALVPIGSGAPIDGAFSEQREVGSEPWKKTVRFRGGERACVMAIGDHRDVVNLHLTVHDEKGNLIAEDQGNGKQVGDYVAVVFYPPRDATYRVEVKQPGPGSNKLYIVIQ